MAKKKAVKKESKMIKTINFYAKCSDCFDAKININGKEIQYDDYPPMFLGDGDGIELTIDLETGMIVGWDKDKAFNELKEIISDEG